MEIFDNVKLHSDYDYFYIENSDYFLTFTDTNNENQENNGIDIVENIIILLKNYNDNNDFKSSLDSFKSEMKINDNFHNYNSYNSYIAQEYPIENIDYFIESSPHLAIINFINNNINLTKVTENLHMAKVKRGYDSINLDLNQIIYINENLTLKDLIKLYKIAIETKIKYFEYLQLPEHIQDSINNNESLILACKSPIEFKKGETQDLMKLINSKNGNSEENLPNSEKLDEIEKELIKTMVKSCNDSLKNMNLSFGILDYIIAEGVTIDSLVDAGMELCVGIEDTPEIMKEIRLKLKNQILKSLEDLNVIALLMSAIRCEEDFQNNRLREVDVSDDPAYLYTDEVLGIAISNQIAGTKATFNFKRYDEEKPGIISELGPMVDDIFAGLVAGCMSKIFEE
ncbi:phosphatidylglycerophosphatase A [Methanobrevibacter sp. TMH8]|nr:phosphatidylglycerophosphatase A [Methanobrevibacter sp. TMH8]